MDLDEQTRSLLQDTLLLNEVPLRFFAELYADVNNAGEVEDELNLDRVADQTEPCVKSANFECLVELYDLFDQRLNTKDPQEFWIFLNTQGGGDKVRGKPASTSPTTGGHNPTVRHLVALLIKLVSLAEPASPEGCSRGLISAACYMRLLRVKGSRAYGAFSSLALQSIVRLLKQFPKLLGCVALQEEEEDDNGEEGGSGNEMDVDTDSNSTGRQSKDGGGRKLVTVWFGKALKELELLLKEVPLSECRDVILQLSEFLGELSGAVIEFKKYGDKATLQRYRQISYSCMLLLLEPKHGAILDTVTQIYKALIGNILMTIGTRNGSHASATKDTITASQMAVEYVRNSINAIQRLNLQPSDRRRQTSESSENTAEESEEPVASPALHKIVILLQQICIRIPDKADYRARGVQVVRDILEHLPQGQQSSFMTWLQKYSRNVKPAYRGFALDVIAGLVGGLEHDEEISEEIVTERRTVSNVLAASSTEMVWLLAGRGADKSPTVRARAVGLLAKIMEKGVSDENSPSAHLAIAFLQNLNRTLPSNITVVQMILNRSDDDKSVVRKATLSLVKALISLEIYQLHHDGSKSAPVTTLPITGKLLPLFRDRSRDPVMSVRKSVITMLADLLEECHELPELWSLWVQCVPPMAMDRESAVQEEAGSGAFRIFIDPLTPEKRKFCKSMFNALVEFDDSLERCFRRLIYLGSKKKTIKSYPAKLLQKIALEDITIEGPWRLLAEISAYCADALDAKAMVKAWEALQNSLQQANWRICTHVLNIIGYIGKMIGKADAKLLQEQFVANLSTFEVSPTLISSMINTIQKLESSENVIGWCAQLLTTCEKLLTRCVLEKNSDESGMDSRLDRYLYTAAAVAQLSPSDIPEKLVTAIQALVASDSEQENISPSVRAQAFVSLGKLCLQNEDYAKRLVSAFARELEVSKDVVVRNNVMVVLCDLCIRYTRLVDPYIPKIACCLRDESKLVRRQTLTMLTRLLQEDYVKWKATLFFKFVTTVVDEDPDIVEFAKFCLCQVLLIKYPAMFFTFFVDTVLFLNASNDRVITTGFSQHDQQLFVMTGQGENERRRHQIYTFLLQNMPDEHRFQLTAKLCVDILGGVVDDAIDIRDPNKAAVLVDALYVLSSKNIKISTKPLKDAGDATEIEDAVNNIAAKARTKILSKISRKNTIENMLPVIIELKRRLERDRSPLLKQLMICLREVVRDFRVEMEDITAGDRRLANEIEFDLRQFEIQQQQQQRQVMAPPSGPLTPRLVQKKGTPVGTPVIAPLGRNHKTPLAKAIGTPAKPMPGQQPFSVPRLRTASHNSAKSMSNTSTPSRAAHLSTPAGLGLTTESSSVIAHGLDISGFGGPITPICGSRRETFSTVILDTPGWSPEVVDDRQALKENPIHANINTVPPSALSMPRSKELSTPVRSSSASALRVMRQGQTTWNITSPLAKSRPVNQKKRAASPIDDYDDDVI